ncbi:MAG: leucine-rich repeat protein [Ruminococcus sp.]|nr:leucine-rich repeat protein [Ruminococcus sp.]
MKKKVLALILSITACLGVATGYNPYVYAESTTEEVINGEYGCLKYAQIDDTNIIIKGYTSIPESGTIEIPETINGIPVTSIGSAAFEMSSKLKSITLPDTITSIGTCAFSYSGIESIVIPDGVTKIEHGAFQLTALKSIVFPENLKEIGGFAFYFCAIDEINLPNGLQTIENNAFSGCQNLENVVIPDNVDLISDNAFSLCHKLKTITIPESVSNVSSIIDINKDTVIIKGAKNSAAYEYAKKDGIKFMYINDGIEYMLGDYDGNTEIDAADASAILTTFSLLQTGNENKLTDSQKKACDIDGDGIINAADASTVLAYYSYSQTGGESIFEAFLD